MRETCRTWRRGQGRSMIEINSRRQAAKQTGWFRYCNFQHDQREGRRTCETLILLFCKCRSYMDNHGDYICTINDNSFRAFYETSVSHFVFFVRPLAVLTVKKLIQTFKNSVFATHNRVHIKISI